MLFCISYAPIDWTVTPISTNCWDDRSDACQVLDAGSRKRIDLLQLETVPYCLLFKTQFWFLAYLQLSAYLIYVSLCPKQD